MTTATRKYHKTVPGYDCRTTCAHTPKGDHGIHGDEWIYIVEAEDRKTALALTVFSNKYPPTVDIANLPAALIRPIGADLSLHVSFPTEPDACLSTAVGQDCAYVNGTCHTYYTSALVARDFYTEHGGGDVDPTEAFWRALEAVFISLNASARESAHKAAEWQRCNHCDGLGRIRKVLP